MVNWSGLAWRIASENPDLTQAPSLPLFVVFGVALLGTAAGLWAVRERVGIKSQLSIAVTVAVFASPHTHPYDLLVLVPALVEVSRRSWAPIVGPILLRPDMAGPAAPLSLGDGSRGHCTRSMLSHADRSSGPHNLGHQQTAPRLVGWRSVRRSFEPSNRRREGRGLVRPLAGKISRSLEDAGGHDSARRVAISGRVTASRRRFKASNTSPTFRACARPSQRSWMTRCGRRRSSRRRRYPRLDSGPGPRAG